MTTVEELDPKKKEEGGIPTSMIAVKPFIDGIEDAEYEELSRIGNEVTSTISATLTNGAELNQIPKNEEYIEYSVEFKTVSLC
ncbi:MAG: hypothetical protein WKG06_47225 [Segetibacter sp.]